MAPVTSYDTAGSYQLLGGNNGSIYYISRWGEALKRALKKCVVALELRWCKRLLVIHWIEKKCKIENSC